MDPSELGRIARWQLAWLAFFATGCGSSDRMAVSPVQGKVFYQGQPVTGAQVVFLSKDSAPAATAITQADGSFRLTTYEEEDGAAPGPYVVTIAKMEADASFDPDAPFDPVADMEAAAKNTGKPAPPHRSGTEDYAPARSLLPAKYNSPTQSPLEYTVQAGEANDFRIDLQD